MQLALIGGKRVPRGHLNRGVTEQGCDDEGVGSSVGQPFGEGVGQ